MMEVTPIKKKRRRRARKWESLTPIERRAAMKQEASTRFYIRRIPPGLKAHFKAWCNARDITMNNALCILMFRLIKGRITIT